MSQKDFEFVKSLKQDFFSQRKIQNTLKAIRSDEKITGWEPWWQIEFALFLSMYNNGHEWQRERLIEVDKRKDSDKQCMKIDFVIRPKNHAKERYILIEFKQSDSTATCIKNMADDVIKVAKARATSIDQRSFWCVGVHPKESKKVVLDICRKNGLETSDVYTKVIPNTGGYAFTIL